MQPALGTVSSNRTLQGAASVAGSTAVKITATSVANPAKPGGVNSDFNASVSDTYDGYQGPDSARVPGPELTLER